MVLFRKFVNSVRFRVQNGGSQAWLTMIRPNTQTQKSPRRPRSLGKTPPIDPKLLAPPSSTLALLARWETRADELRAKLAEFVALLLDANRFQNLTADRTPEKQWTAHVEDALHDAGIMEENFGRPGANSRILDVGSGGGMPGLVWAVLWPEASVVLLEANGKKARFLERAIHRLGLSRAWVIQDRAETAAHLAANREQFDWVTARALAPLPVLAEWTLPFAKWGGHVFAIKGDEIEEEMNSSRRAFGLLGAPEPPRIFPYTRSDGKTCRLLAFHKTAMTPSPYPRRIGVASKNPL